MRTRDTNKEEIVKQKTIEMIVKHGIEGFAMNRLAKECGISVATLYIYYTDKEDLIKKVGTELGTYFFKSSLKEVKVLFDKIENGHFVGRTEGDSPEVDNEVLIPVKGNYVRLGDFAEVTITDASEYDLIGVLK